MAIAFISGATQQIPPYSFTAHSGSTNPCLVVATYCGGGAGATATDVTYNSVSMTKIGAIVSSSVDPNTELSVWILANPASGANNIAVTRSNGTFSRVSPMSFSGVHQTTPYNSGNYASKEDTNSGDADSQAITTAQDNSWLIGGLLSPNGTPTLVVDSNTALSATGASNYFGWYSPAAQTPAGSHALGYTNNQTGVLFVAEMYPDTASFTSIKTFNGLANASVKTYNGLARASVKTFNGLA